MPKKSVSSIVNTSLGIRISSHEKLTAERHKQILKSVDELNTKDEIENKKIADAKAIYDAEQWKRNRQAEYPNHEDCIHALLDGGDTLTDLQAKRTAVKNKYPKE